MTSEAHRTGARRTAFFWAIALAMLATLVFGFARSFFLQPLFDAEPLTLAMIVHGLCGTAWFALLVWQAWLARAGRMRDHHSWGAYGPWVAGSVVLSALWLVALTAADGELTGSGLPESVGLFIQLSTTTWFAVLATLAFRHRNNAAMHKRLMVLATITMMAPAFSRISRLFRDGGPPPVDSAVMAIPFIIALAVHDWRALGRIHPATLWAGGLYMLWTQIRLPLGRSDLWTNFVTPLLGG